MVSFNSADKQLLLKNKKNIKRFIASIFDTENRPLKRLDYIFCSDDYLLQINIRFLQHNYFTDIITFPSSEKGQPITGEVYVSLDRIKDNARIYNSSILNETLRVLFHGALHLCGYGDKTGAEEKTMRAKESSYIKTFHAKPE